MDKNENAKNEIKPDFELEIEFEDRDMEDEEILTGFEKA